MGPFVYFLIAGIYGFIAYSVCVLCVAENDRILFKNKTTTVICEISLLCTISFQQD